MKVPVPEYGAVPPDADTVTVVVPPKHAIVPADEEATTEHGIERTVAETLVVQP